jgi:hypothetical protein
MDGWVFGIEHFILLLERKRERGCKLEQGGRKKDCMVMGWRSCYIEDNEGWMLCSACFA